MALTRQLYKNQGGSDDSTNSWFAHQNTLRQQEANRILNERQLHQSRIEYEMQESESKLAKHKQPLRERTFETERRLWSETRNQDERLAIELERIKVDKLRNEKMRQYIRETNPELRELESKLRLAYIQKERTVQIAEKQTIKLKCDLEDAAIVRHMRNEIDKAEEDRHQQELRRQQEMIHYKQELEQQIETNKLNKQKAYEEFLREKLIIDEIIQKIHEENQREIERKLECQRATREFIVDFKRKREEWKVKERQRIEEENRRIKEYVKIQEQRQEIIKVEKHARDQAFDRLQCTLIEQIKRHREEREEQELIQQELYLEEQKQAIRKREQNEIELRIKQRLGFQREYEEQMNIKHLRAIEAKQEEERFRQQLMEKFAEDDRIEQMNARKRRMKQIEHKRAIENLLEERRHKLELEKEHKIEEYLNAERIEQIRKEIIEEERIKLLDEHAHRLLGYLPKGIIRNEKDLDYLGNDFKREYFHRSNNF